MTVYISTAVYWESSHENTTQGHHNAGHLFLFLYFPLLSFLSLDLYSQAGYWSLLPSPGGSVWFCFLFLLVGLEDECVPWTCGFLSFRTDVVFCT